MEKIWVLENQSLLQRLNSFKKWNLGLRIHVLVYFIQDELEEEEYKDEELFLFNLDSDPTEKINLASSLPEIVKQLEVKS